MGTVAAVVHNKDRKVMTNIVLCPPHLVEKWQREILRAAPLSEVAIVENFESFLEVLPKIKDHTMRKKHLWIVMSKEAAKYSYNERPAAVWSKSKGAMLGRHYSEGVYCCPDCGQPLFSIHYEGSGRRRREVRAYFTHAAFKDKNASNTRCHNTVKRWNNETHAYEEVECGAALWTPYIKDHYNIAEAWEETRSCPKYAEGHAIPRWVKTGKKGGWLELDRIQDAYDDLNFKLERKRIDNEMMADYALMLDEGVPSQVAPRKFSIAKYIKTFCKGDFDYALADEIQELKGSDSLQGQAFGAIVAASRKVICMTGTLLNGYAAGVFYMLYRTCPSLMKKEGFEFSAASESEFTKRYGVYKKVDTFEWEGGQQGKRTGGEGVKALPGVSPLVFTKFMLNNAVFMGLDDISDALPGYEEIPIGVDMDPGIRMGYSQLEADLRNFGNGNNNRGSNNNQRERNSMKTMAQAIQLLSVYPDKPYDQPPVINPDNGAVVTDPMNISRPADGFFAKERTLLNLIREKIETGEKVMVYYSFVSRCDIANDITAKLKEEGINCATLKSNVKPAERETWISDRISKGLDVLFVNPELVKTGLDLLDFTTIIFYQTSYNLFTLRQAARRSWRLSQTKDVTVYFLYYRETVQETAMSLMATKLQAAMAVEGKFSEEGLNAMSANEDVLTQIAASVTEGIRETVDASVFSGSKKLSGAGVVTLQEAARRTEEVEKPRRLTLTERYDVAKKKNKAPLIEIALGKFEDIVNQKMLLSAS